MLPALPPQSFVVTGEVSKSIVCFRGHEEVEAEALGYLLACPCCWVFKHRCLLLLTLSDKWRHFFHRKESQEFPCSLFIHFFPFCIVVKSLLLGRGWRRLAQGRGEVALI